ncbi:MAG: LysM peptidoglycan-binding domain-containing protein [Lentisphaeria bacterium]|jgi:LysM repeat protein
MISIRSKTVMALGVASLLLAAGCRSSKPQDPGLLGPRQLVPPPAVPAPAETPELTPPAPTTPELTAKEAAALEQGLAKPSKPVAPPAVKPLTYTVKPGDTLSRIATIHGVSVAELAAFNKMTAKAVLRVGRTLQIPPGGKYDAKAAARIPRLKKVAASAVPKPKAPTAPAAAAAPEKPAAAGPAAAPTPGEKYKVQPGDSLWLIAKKHSVHAADIRTLNNLKSDSLQVGQELLLPAATGAPAAPATPEIAAPPAPGAAAAPPAEVAAPPAATAAAIPSDKTMDASVFENETLETIAPMYGTTVEAILRLNPQIKGNADLKPGVTILKVPMAPAP